VEFSYGFWAYRFRSLFFWRCARITNVPDGGFHSHACNLVSEGAVNEGARYISAFA
jgi:hypothetical protein